MALISIKKISIFISLILAVAVFIPPISHAHEGRIIGDYRLVVGNKNEPAFASVPNGIDISVIRITGIDKLLIVSREIPWKVRAPQQGRGTENHSLQLLFAY